MCVEGLGVGVRASSVLWGARRGPCMAMGNWAWREARAAPLSCSVACLSFTAANVRSPKTEHRSLWASAGRPDRRGCSSREMPDGSKYTPRIPHPRRAGDVCVRARTARIDRKIMIRKCEIKGNTKRKKRRRRARENAHTVHGAHPRRTRHTAPQPHMAPTPPLPPNPSAMITHAHAHKKVRHSA